MISCSSRVAPPQWNIDFIRVAQDWELDAIIEFFDLLYSIRMIEVTIDEMNWREPSKKGRFTVTFHQVLTNPGMTTFP